MSRLPPSAFCERSFDVAAPESDVFLPEPDSWYAPSALLSPHPALRDIEVKSELFRREQRFEIGIAVAVLSALLRGFLHQSANKKHERFRNLIAREAIQQADQCAKLQSRARNLGRT